MPANPAFNAPPKPGPDDLTEAVKAGDREGVRALLAAGIDPNEENRFNCVPLMWAAWIGQLEIARLLIDSGANVNYKGTFGDTPLIFSARAGHIEIVRLLADSGADIDGREARLGETALMAAVREGKINVAALLIAAGADVNSRDKAGNTALIYAVLKPSLNIARLLIDSGADIEAENDAGNTALSLASEEKIIIENFAAEKNRIEIKRLLQAAAVEKTQAAAEEKEMTRHASAVLAQQRLKQLSGRHKIRIGP